ncbi:MAG: M56 family metallopeptidase, partial [Muribaculaceae bacterium]|nr:M56 family metallopeptidase [Muribaculaceae bacterium]
MDNTMGTLFSYSIFSGLFLACGYVAYRLLLSGEKQPGLNRAALLTVYAVSLLAMPASLLRLAMAPEAPAAGHMVEAGTVTAILTATPTPASAISHVLLCGFLAGLIAVGAWTLLGIARLRALIAGGRRVRREGYTLVVLKDCAVPVSFMNYIVMSEADALKSESMITAHELGHLRRRHWLDLLLAQAVCVLMWYNPAAWLMRRELRSVHEYQADGSAIQTDGVDARIYQLLLIEKAAGVRLQSLANSLNHSNIYKRITMMNKQFNRPARRMRVLALVPAIAMAAALVNSPAVASAINSAGNATLL